MVSTKNCTTAQTIAVVMPAVILSFVLFVECGLITEWLGRVLDRTDVAALEPGLQ